MAKQVKTKLTRQDMENVIAGGGSVLHGGVIITKIKDLPDAADLAETDEEIAAVEEEVKRETDKVAAKKEKVTAKKTGGAHKK